MPACWQSFLPTSECKQQDSLLQERGEGLCPLEADRDEESPVEPCEVEGASACVEKGEGSIDKLFLK